MMPEKIGRYEIKSELGRGGMATVYRGYDPLFEREVAVKVLPPELLHADPQFALRFEREAKIVAQLEHPSIVPVYDVGSDGGQPYFVMRYMSGGSLSDRIKARVMSIEDAIRIIAQIAPGLDEAHAKGIVHRDLKPSNILFDARGTPYISDFGIAKLSQAQAGNVTGSAIIGTPAYMAPEQAQGESVDSRSDIYALGIILFEMLTGKQPYVGDTPMAVAIKHITDPVPNIIQVNPALPIVMENIIQMAMAKNKDDRFATAGEMLKALRAVSTGSVAQLENMPEKINATISVPKVTKASIDAGKVPTQIGRINFNVLVAIILLFLITTIGILNRDVTTYVIQYGPYLLGIGLAVAVGGLAINYTIRAVRWYASRPRREKPVYPDKTKSSQQPPSSSMTFNVLAEIDPRKRQEILTLIGRDHEMRLKDKIIHFGGGRYLLHGYGRFGATALIDQIVKLAKYDLASQGEAEGNGIVMTIRIDASTIKETEKGIDAVIQEFRFEAKRGNYSKPFTTQLNKLYKNKIAEIENSSREHTMAIKVAPIPGISAEFARKTGQNSAPEKKISGSGDLMETLVAFLDRAEKHKPLMFESFVYKFMSSKETPTRLIVIIDKIESEIVFDTLKQMKLFKETRISFFAIVGQDMTWLDNPKVRKAINDLGFELHYVPCLWEEETNFVDNLIKQAFTIKNKADREQDFKDHIAFVARGSPGDAVKEALRHEYCEFKLGMPILNLSAIRDWEMLQINAQIQRILCNNWEKILSTWFKGASNMEKDRAKRAIYDVMDWINSRVVFTLPEIREFAGHAPIKISDREVILNSVLKSLVSILVEEKFLVSKGDYLGVAHRVKQEDLQ